MVCSQNSKKLFLFSKSKLQLLGTVFRSHFSTIYFQPSFRFCRLTPNGSTSTFEVPMGTSYESGESTQRGEAASRCAWWSCVATCTCSYNCCCSASCAGAMHAHGLRQALTKQQYFNVVPRGRAKSETFAGWALTEGQHRPKAGKKKKIRKAGLSFLVPS